MNMERLVESKELLFQALKPVKYCEYYGCSEGQILVKSDIFVSKTYQSSPHNT
jgi:hypothetical protein